MSSWQYPPSGPTPPSPVVVDTVPTYFGGRPTPPPSPPRVHATVDDYAPCPPSPRSSVDECTGPSSGLDYWTISELRRPTSSADPLTDESSNDRPGSVAPHVSDDLIYDRETYAYPSPVLAMIERATLDTGGLEAQPVDPWACGEPFRLFSFFAGYIPLTGLPHHDKQTFGYYAKVPHPSPLREPECAISYRFSISTVHALQHELRTTWRLVYPEPIPPVIIRLSDLVGPRDLRRRADGYAFVVPTEDSIWATACQRGIDSSFRPINPSATVETGICTMGEALYKPQHIVASKFAVNVFLELPNPAGLIPRCEYLGAYILREMDGLTIAPAIWADVDPEVQQSVFDRVPDHFYGPQHPFPGCPLLPYVYFSYYKWDRCIIGLADDIRHHDIFEASHGSTQPDAESDSIDSDDSMDFDTDHDTASIPSVYSDEQGYTSFFEFSPCV